MSQLGLRILAGSFIAALLPSGAAAQPIAATLSDLQALLNPRDYVIVIDTSDNETWGQAVNVSESAITVAKAVRSGDRVTITSERRVFDDANIRAVLRSDAGGVKGATIYPASWDAVDALPRDADVTVTLAGGERKQFRFAGATADSFHGLTASGQREALKKSGIARIERHGVEDPTSDGIVIGALVGTGIGAGLMAVGYAACEGSFDAPARGPMFLAAMGFGAGVGAATGWIVDRLHKGKETIFPAVAPIVVRNRKGIAISMRF